MNVRDITTWTALVTPFHDDQTIDFESMDTLIEWQRRAGNGLLMLGSTGEALQLNRQERESVIRQLEKHKSNAPVMVGVGGQQLNEQIEWIKWCQESGLVDAFLLPVPLYAKPGRQGQIQWFEALMDASDLPCMLYNIPSRSGAPLHIDAYKQLVKHPKCFGLKEASGDLEVFKAYRSVSSEMKVLSGEDGQLPHQCILGCDGLVSAVANIWPEGINRFVSSCLKGDFEGLFPLWSDAAAAAFRASNPIPAKVMLHRLGKISTPTLRPPLTHLDLVDPRELMNVHERVQEYL